LHCPIMMHSHITPPHLENKNREGLFNGD